MSDFNFSTKAAKTFVESESKYLSAGIAEDVVIESARFETSPTGAKYITTNLKKGDSIVNMTTWEPKQWPGDTEDALKGKYLKVIYRLSQVLEAIYPVGDPILDFEGKDFSDIVQWYIGAVEKSDKTKLVRAKFTYSRKGYLTLPEYAKYRFVEPMVKPANWPYEDVAINDRDILVRPVIADANTDATQNPFTPGATTMNATTAPQNTQTLATAQQPVASELPF